MGALMNFNRALAAFVVVVFLGICAYALTRRGSDTSPTAPSASVVASNGGPPAAAPGTLPIFLVSSNAKQTFIDKAVDEFNKLKIDVGGKTVIVKVEHVNSGDSWNEIKEGRSKPDLWSPGDESWIRIANDAWKGLYSKPLFDKSEPLVNVPLCIAMWEPMAQALGYPKPIGWTDIAKISADPQGWGRYGHPEWGPFKWGHAHVDANSGFLTVVSEVYATTGKTKGLTVDDLKKKEVLAAVTQMEQSVAHYGLSSVWIDNFMREKGPAYLSAAVQYENAIVEGNKKTQNKPFRVVAIYPKEGTVLNQHPIAIAQGDWMNDDRKAASQKFIDYLLKPETQTMAMSLGLRPISKAIRITEPFTPEWGVLADLPAIPTFEVPSEDILRRVTDLWLDAKKPASVMMLVDISGSMSGEPMEKAKEGAVGFIERMHARDELEIRTFNNVITQLLPVAPVATAGEEAKTKVRGLFANGGTHLYEVLRDATTVWNDRKKKNPNRHYGIVILTDGQDEGSRISRADLMDVLPKGDNPETVKIFSIAYGQKADKTFLQEVSNKSNARLFESTSKNIARVYQELSANF